MAPTEVFAVHRGADLCGKSSQQGEREAMLQARIAEVKQCQPSMACSSDRLRWDAAAIDFDGRWDAAAISFDGRWDAAAIGFDGM